MRTDIDDNPYKSPSTVATACPSKVVTIIRRSLGTCIDCALTWLISVAGFAAGFLAWHRTFAPYDDVLIGTLGASAGTFCYAIASMTRSRFRSRFCAFVAPCVLFLVLVYVLDNTEELAGALEYLASGAVASGAAGSVYLLLRHKHDTEEGEGFSSARRV
jgi:hypothetical protein